MATFKNMLDPVGHVVYQPEADPGSRFRGGVILVIFGSQVSLRARYCKRDEVYVPALLRQNNGRQNGLISRMLLSELYKIMVKKVDFVRF